jgi:thioredoxin-related protein
VIEIRGKRVIVLIFAVLLITMLMHVDVNVSVNAQSAIEWHTYQEGIQIAESQNKSAMIFFYSDGCPWCEKEIEAFNDEKVIEMSKNFISIIGSGRLAGQYHITGVPAIVFTNSQSVEVYRTVGYHDADMLVEEMQQALKLSNSPLQTPQKQEQVHTPGFGAITALAAIFMCRRWFRRGCVK